jgi:hypothetical protein
MTKLDPQVLASLFGITLQRLASAMRCDFEFLASHPEDSQVQDALELLVWAWQVLESVMSSDDAIRQWLRHPNRRLDGLTPLEILDTGGPKRFAALAEEIDGGAYA